MTTGIDLVIIPFFAINIGESNYLDGSGSQGLDTPST